jgi:hypothetical protein
MGDKTMKTFIYYTTSILAILVGFLWVYAIGVIFFKVFEHLIVF